MKGLIRVAAAVLGVATVAAAAVNGAIFTTTGSGTTVNGNIYESKSDVFVNGGPQNDHGALLSPDGLYYFQVTDPSGAVLLSTDDVRCRVAVVANGRVSGVASSDCAHAVGARNAANGTTPIALMPYKDTPNNGGEYKVWITPVAAYGVDCKNTQGSFGFCDAASKTDNFKVLSSAIHAAQITVCKFNDYNANGVRDGAEPMIAHWPISATGVDGGNADAQTDDRGCTAFTFSGFTSTLTAQTITLSEGTFGPDWIQTAPANDGGVITLTVHPGDVVAAPDFGNANPFCQEGCVPGGVIATANAYPSVVRTFEWEIAKSADRSRITSATAQAITNYTVTVTHDAGTDSDWKLAGSMRVANSGGQAMTGLTLAAAADGGVCTVAGATNVAIAAGSHNDFNYSCTFAAAPAAGSVHLDGSWSGGQLSATTPFDFSTAVIAMVDDQAAVTDTMTGSLGTVLASSPSPTTFTYGRTIAGTPGTCTTTNNTATFTTNSTAATRSAWQAVQLCVGANLSASQTATASMTSSIAKSVDRSLVEQQGGSITFNYNVTVIESAWQVTGVITVVNPNDWQPVSASLVEALPGANCSVATPSVVVPASSSINVPYSCAFTAAPPASVVATASVNWDSAAAFTTSSSVQATATAAFQPLTVVDAFNGGAATTLGTIAVPTAMSSYPYPRTVTNAPAGTCQAVTNVASLSGTPQSASQTAYACNTLTGARTIGFWQNKNGQAILTGAASTVGACNAATWLRQFAAFQDLAAGSSCKALAAYATTIIKNASAAGAAMNAMLKAQMAATALNVFFSDPALGANALGALTSVGNVRIDVSKSSDAFGGATSMTVMQLLAAQNGVSNTGGSIWYGQVKAVQELAKNVFDAINNELAPIAK